MSCRVANLYGVFMNAGQQAAPSRRRPNQAGERRRLQMLNAAEVLVRELGHQNVTMQMIAEAVGVSQPAVHHHFASRDHLFTELLRLRDARAVEATAVDAIEALILAAHNNADSPHLAALFVDYSSRAVDRSNPAHEYFSTRNRVLLAYFTTAVRERHLNAGSRAPHEPEHTALVLLTLSDGLLARWLIDSTLDIEGELRFAIAALRLPGL